jgi:hypothetical protein
MANLSIGNIAYAPDYRVQDAQTIKNTERRFTLAPWCLSRGLDMPKNPVSQAHRPTVGSKWYVKLPTLIPLAKVEVRRVGKSTVDLIFVGAKWELDATIYKLSDIEFVEEVND